jgi:methionine synthase II (cobalamin-independent)
MNATRANAPIEFWFDFASGYAHFAARDIEALAERHGQSVLLRLLTLGAAFKVASVSRAKHPLKEVPVLVAGVIDSLTNFVEHPEVVADRIERVAAVVGDPARVLAGTDCGFDTSAGWGRVAEDVVWAKLASLRDGARLASDRLIPRTY